MEREFRAVFVIALIFLILGLSSLFSLGGFVTPFFFGRLILVVISLAFFVINIKLEKSIYLFFSFIAMLSFALIDNFTVTYLSQKTETQFLIELSYNQVLIVTSFIFYFGFFFSTIFLLHQKLQKKGMALGLTALLLLSLFLFYLRLYEWQNLLFSSFLLIYVVVVNRLEIVGKSTLKVISALFLLQFLLEVFKYLFRLEELI